VRSAIYLPTRNLAPLVQQRADHKSRPGRRTGNEIKSSHLCVARRVGDESVSAVSPGVFSWVKFPRSRESGLVQDAPAIDRIIYIYGSQFCLDNASCYDVMLQFRRFWRCRDIMTSAWRYKIVSAILQVNAATNAFHSVFLQSTAFYIETDLVLEKIPARQEERCNCNARKVSETAVYFSCIYKRNSSHFSSRITCFR
jgi:hypothetical protein